MKGNSFIDEVFSSWFLLFLPQSLYFSVIVEKAKKDQRADLIKLTHDTHA
jgi:hypothetical protein